MSETFWVVETKGKAGEPLYLCDPQEKSVEIAPLFDGIPGSFKVNIFTDDIHVASRFDERAEAECWFDDWPDEIKRKFFAAEHMIG